MKRIVLYLILFFAGSKAFASTQTYYISQPSLYNCASNCGTGSYYNGCVGDNIGFNWTDVIPVGNTITAVSIQFSIGVDCDGGSHPTYLNGTYQTNFSTSAYCNCSAPGINGVSSIAGAPANYIRGGSNQFLTTSLGSCYGFCPDASLSNYYAIVTVTYVSAQNTVPSSGNNSYTTCSDHIYDNGGSASNYSNNMDGYSVLYPTAGNVIQIFGTYSTEANYDYIYVYNGVGTGGTLLGQYSGSGSIPTFTSTDPSGALTVRFYADPFVISSGFDITISCVAACAPPGTPTPATFGSSIWNVYCYNGGSLNLTSCTYKGYYTESSLSYDSQTKWSNVGTPSSAPGYSGCSLPIDYHTVIYKRQDFPCGKYQLDIPAHDDDIRVYVNGTQVFEHIGCCDVHTNIWTGYLTTGSTVEVRHAEFTGGSQQALTLTNVTPAIVNGSLTLNGVASNVNICTGSTVAVAQGTGGSFPEADYYYWIGVEDPVGSGWVTAWSIWNGANQNNPTPANPPAFATPGRYVVHTNAINTTCGWAYYGAGRTRFVDVLAAPVAPTSLTASPSSICSGNNTTLTTGGGTGAYYTFNNTLADASGNGLTLTGAGGTLSPSGIQLTTASAYSSPVTEILNSDKYTIDFYMQYTATFDGTWRKIFGYTPTGTDRSPGIWKYPSSLQLHWRNDPGNTGLAEAQVFNVGQWYHIVGEKNGGTLTKYVDGVLVDQGPIANPKTPGESILWFGGAPVLLKEFKVYNGIFRWYTGSCGGSLVGVGPTIVVNPVVTTTYYVREEGDCGNSSCASATVTVLSSAAASGGSDQYVCSTVTSVTMAATGAGTWTQLSGAAATITTPTSPTTTITGLATGTYVFRWTVGCNYDDVVIVRQ